MRYSFNVIAKGFRKSVERAIESKRRCFIQACFDGKGKHAKFPVIMAGLYDVKARKCPYLNHYGLNWVRVIEGWVLIGNDVDKSSIYKVKTVEREIRKIKVPDDIYVSIYFVEHNIKGVNLIGKKIVKALRRTRRMKCRKRAG